MTPVLPFQDLLAMGGLLAVYGYARWRQRAVRYLRARLRYRNRRQRYEEEEDMEQLTFEDHEAAVAAKEAVLERLMKRESGWGALALEKFLQVRHQLPTEFIGEDIRKLLLTSGVPEPVSSGVWGGFTGGLSKRKLIVDTGRTRTMRAKDSHARRSPLYILAREPALS